MEVRENLHFDHIFAGNRSICGKQINLRETDQFTENAPFKKNGAGLRLPSDGAY